MSVCGQPRSLPRFRLGDRSSLSQLAALKHTVTPKPHRVARKAPQFDFALFNDLKFMSSGPMALLEGHRPGHSRAARSFALAESKAGSTGMFSIREAEEKDLQQTAQVFRETFKTYYRSVGEEFEIPIDVVMFVLGDLQANPQKRLLIAVAVDGDGEEGDVIGMTGLRIDDPIAAVRIVAVSPPKSGAGIGRALVKNALDICEQRGENAPVCLTHDAGNCGVFALYASMGFTVVEVCTMVEGFVSDDLADEAIQAVAKTGTHFRKMEEEDVVKCNDMCMNVIGHSRKNNIAERRQSRGPPCIVAARLTDAGQEEVVAYSTSLAFSGHSVAVDEQHFKALVSYGSKLAKSEGKRGVNVRCIARANPAIIQWALKAGLRVNRQFLWMERGGSLSINPDYVYSPGPDY